MVRLEPRSATILDQLQAANGAIVTRQELLDLCWEPGSGSDEALTQAVAQIRRAFEQLGVSQAIETLAKRGYRLNASLGSETTVPGSAGTVRHLRLPLAIASLAIVAVLAISFAHPLRHAIRHALGLGPPQSAAPNGH